MASAQLVKLSEAEIDNIVVAALAETGKDQPHAAVANLNGTSVRVDMLNPSYYFDGMTGCVNELCCNGNVYAKCDDITKLLNDTCFFALKDTKGTQRELVIAFYDRALCKLGHFSGTVTSSVTPTNGPGKWHSKK